MSLARALVAELVADPLALAELRAALDESSDRSRDWSPYEVAAHHQVSVRTVNRWASEGRIHAQKVGRSWRFDPDRLEVLPLEREEARVVRRRARARTGPSGLSGADVAAAIRGDA